MDKKDLIEQESDKTLGALDGIGKAELNPYLYSKILNEINRPSSAERKFNFGIALTVLLICVFINVATLFSVQSYVKSSPANVSAVSSVHTADSLRNAEIKSFASEYSSTNTFYFY